MDYRFNEEDAYPTEYGSMELFHLFRDLGLFEHLSSAELAAAEQGAGGLPDDIPLLPVFVLLAAPRSALFFDTGLAEQDSKQYDLPAYSPTEWPASLADLQGIARGKIQFEEPSAQSGEGQISSAVDYANERLLSMALDERFYWLLFRDDLVHNAGPYMRKMILFLSSTQRILLGRRMIFKFKDRQAHTWTSQRIDDVLKSLEALGILNHYRDDELARAKEKLYGQQHSQIASVLQCLPNLVYWIDAEMIYEPSEDYAELIDGLREISRGLFEPKDVRITDADFNHPEFTITFTLDDAEHTIPMEYRGDYVNWDFMEGINQIMQPRARSGRFVLLPSDDQTAPIIFLEDHQYRAAREWNLFGQGTVVVAEDGLGSY